MEEMDSQQIENLMEQDESVLKELKKGNNIVKIALMLNLDRKNVNASIKRLMDNGLITSEKIAMYQDDAIDRVVLELVNKKYSVVQIYELTKLGYKDIILAKERLAKRGKLDEKELNLNTRVKEERKDKLVELLKSGLTRKEASKMLNMSMGTIYEYTTELIREGKIKKEEIHVDKAGRKSNKTTDIHVEVEQKTEQENEDVEQRVIEMLQEGLNFTQILREFALSPRNMRSVIDKVIREERVKVPDKKSNTPKKQEEQPNITIEEDEDKTNLYRYRTALNSIYTRTRNGKIDNQTKKLCYMYCRNIVNEGVELKDRELELLAETIAKGEGTIDTKAIRLVAREYTKRENLVPAIEMLDECIDRSEDKEKLYVIRKMMQNMQARIEQHKRDKKVACEDVVR